MCTYFLCEIESLMHLLRNMHFHPVALCILWSVHLTQSWHSKCEQIACTECHTNQMDETGVETNSQYISTQNHVFTVCRYDMKTSDYIINCMIFLKIRSKRLPKHRNLFFWHCICGKQFIHKIVVFSLLFLLLSICNIARYLHFGIVQNSINWNACLLLKNDAAHSLEGMKAAGWNRVYYHSIWSSSHRFCLKQWIPIQWENVF